MAKSKGELCCELRKSAITERYVFFSRGFESNESIVKYATVVRNMALNIVNSRF